MLSSRSQFQQSSLFVRVLFEATAGVHVCKHVIAFQTKRHVMFRWTECTEEPCVYALVGHAKQSCKAVSCMCIHLNNS